MNKKLSSIKEVITKGTVRAVLALALGGAAIVGFLVTKQIDADAFEKLVMLALVFYYVDKTSNGNVS